MDAFLEIDAWKDANCLLKSCNFAVIARDGVIFSDILNTITKKLSREFGEFKFHRGDVEPESGLKCFRVNSSPYVIVPLETTPVNISSTDIREKVGHGVSIQKLVPEKVNIYIEKNQLYL